MKRIIASLLAALMLVSVLTGCGASDDPNQGIYVVEEFAGYAGDELNDVMGGQISITLEAKGKGTIAFGDESNGITWKTEGDAITVTEDGFDDVMTGTISNGVMTLDLGGGVVMDFVKQ